MSTVPCPVAAADAARVRHLPAQQRRLRPPVGRPRGTAVGPVRGDHAGPARLRRPRCLADRHAGLAHRRGAGAGAVAGRAAGGRAPGRPFLRRHGRAADGPALAIAREEPDAVRAGALRRAVRGPRNIGSGRGHREHGPAHRPHRAVRPARGGGRHLRGLLVGRRRVGRDEPGPPGRPGRAHAQGARRVRDAVRRPRAAGRLLALDDAGAADPRRPLARAGPARRRPPRLGNCRTSTWSRCAAWGTWAR